MHAKYLALLGTPSDGAPISSGVYDAHLHLKTVHAHGNFIKLCGWGNSMVKYDTRPSVSWNDSCVCALEDRKNCKWLISDCLIITDLSRDMTKPTKWVSPSEDSDQTGRMPSLIWVFAVRMKKAWVLSYPLSAQRRLWPESSLGAHSFVCFVMSRLILCLIRKQLCEKSIKIQVKNHMSCSVICFYAKISYETHVLIEFCLLSRHKIAYSIRNVEIGTYYL